MLVPIPPFQQGEPKAVSDLRHAHGEGSLIPEESWAKAMLGEANFGLIGTIAKLGLGVATGGLGGGVIAGLSLLAGSGEETALAATGPCPGIGSVRLPNGTCVNLGDLGPGGAPAITPQSNGAVAIRPVAGAFGIPAAEPVSVTKKRLKCPRGMVLGIDDNCYPKAVLSRRNKFRKWRQPTRPKFTAADMKAINKADSLIEQAKELNKKLGLRVPSRKKKG